jgi:hypothetical protein
MALLICDGESSQHKKREGQKGKRKAYLVRSSVVQVLPLEPNPRTPNMLRQPLRLIKLTRPVNVPKLALPLIPELRVGPRRRISSRKLLEGVVERFGDVSSSELAETSGGGDLLLDGFDLFDLVFGADGLLGERSGAGTVAGDLLTVGFDCRGGGGGTKGGRVFDDGDELRTDDNTVGVATDLLEVSLSGDTETDSEGNGVGKEGTDAFEHSGEGGRNGVGGAGGTHLRDDLCVGGSATSFSFLLAERDGTEEKKENSDARK